MRRLRPWITALVVATLSCVVMPSTASASAPGIDALSPARGPVDARVAVLGSGFSTTREVTFGTIQATFRIASDTKIVTKVPQGATSGDVTVTTSDGSAVSPDPFFVQPNIVLILTDDQRAEEIEHMPTLESTIADDGTTFRKGFVVDPLCCPSRASILTGRYSHGTDIYANGPPHGGFDTFTGDGEDNSTVATWLQNEGSDPVYAAEKALMHERLVQLCSPPPPGFTP